MERAMLFNDTSALPADFPRVLTVVLKEGEHRGEMQLWAPLEHGGKCFKLVISEWSRLCEPGETWEVIPRQSPNGHVVFCRAHKRLATSSGMHPILALAREHLRKRCSIWKPRNGSILEWTREGTLEMAELSDDVLQIWIGDVRLREDGGMWLPDFLRRQRDPEDYLFECRIDWIFEKKVRCPHLGRVLRALTFEGECEITLYR